MSKRKINKGDHRLVAAVVLQMGGQRFVAARIGVSVPTISRWENGLTPVPAAAAELLRQILEGERDA